MWTLESRRPLEFLEVDLREHGSRELLVSWSSGDVSFGPLSVSEPADSSPEPFVQMLCDAALLTARISCRKLAGWMLMSSMLEKREWPLVDWR